MDKKTQNSGKEEAAESGEKEPYPKAIYFILGNEFCERFTYYGIRTICALYLTEALRYSEDTSTLILHFFIMLSYFTPLLGAIMADSWLGKYKTIMYISVLYAVGNIVVSIGALPAPLSTMRAVSILGLIVIAFGTGGIKPCVSAFGGDQFSHKQADERAKFFSLFYFVINSGSVLSTMVTPELRADISCFGDETCYSLAFGVPAILMAVSIILFIIGKPLYKMLPVTGNAFVRVCKCICHAIAQKSKSRDKKKEHFLDYAEDEYEKSFIDDVKKVLHVLWIFLPLPIFWTLFDQTSSRWTLQATRLDGDVYGWHIKADQMQVFNPVMILIFIPIFDYIIYPLLNKCNLLTKPLQRMAAGGLIAALSFVMSGFLEMATENAMPAIPKAGYTEFNVINNSPCIIHISGDIVRQVDAFQYNFLQNLKIGEESTWEFKPNNCSISGKVSLALKPKDQWALVTITVSDGELKVNQVNDGKIKPVSGEPRFRFLYSGVEFDPKKKLSFKVANSRNLFIEPNITSVTDFGSTDYKNIKPGHYKIYLPGNLSDHENTPVGEEYFRSGGSYIVMVYQNGLYKKFTVITTVEPNQVSILMQIPQYVVITAGEIMFSITGLEFSYSQAPLSLKSVIQSAWLLTVAFGNMVVMIIAKSRIFNRTSYEMFMFAVLMVIDMIIFMVMAFFYKYQYVHAQSSETLDAAGKKDHRKGNSTVDETDFNK